MIECGCTSCKLCFIIGFHLYKANFFARYHHLNHHAIFGGGYRSGAMSIMQKLVRKYGKDE